MQRRIPSQVPKFKRVEKALTEAMLAWAVVGEEVGRALEGGRTEREAALLVSVQEEAKGLHRRSAELFQRFKIGLLPS